MWKTWMLKKTGIKKQHKNNKVFNTKHIAHSLVFIDKYYFSNNIARLINISFLLEGEIND